MTTEQFGKLRKVFDRYDVNGDGTIDERELWTLLRDVYQPSTSDLQMVMRRFDDNGDGVLSRNEFLRFCALLADPETGEHVFDLTPSTRKRLLEVFDTVDKNGSNSIEVDNAELADAMRKILPINRSLLKRTLLLMDKDGTRSVDFEEFVDAIARLGGNLGALWRNVEVIDPRFPARRTASGLKSSGSSGRSKKKQKGSKADADAEAEPKRELTREESVNLFLSQHFRQKPLDLGDEEAVRPEADEAGGGVDASGRGTCERACGKVSSCAVM